MASFCDRLGDTWELVLTVGRLPRLREAGVDIGDSDSVAACAGDPERLGSVLWVLCDPRSRGLTPEDWGDRFDGPTLARAEDALAEALADFICRRPVIAEAAKRLLRDATAARDAKVASMSSDCAGNSPASADSTPGT
jgi:hypothetical protein